MVTIRRNIEHDCLYHIYNRSVDQRIIFYSDTDYCWFLEKVNYYRDKFEIKILAFALLPTHFHFILREPNSTPGVDVGIKKFVSCLTNSYVKHYNYLRGRKGNLFEGRYKSKLVSDDYYLHALIGYVNNNAVKHNIVKNPVEWDFTSYWDYDNRSKFNLVNQTSIVDFDDYARGVGNYINILGGIGEEFSTPGVD